MRALRQNLTAVFGALLSLLAMGDAHADVIVELRQITLLNVNQTASDPDVINEYAAAARAIGPDTIAGVFKTSMSSNANGFTVANPPITQPPTTWVYAVTTPPGAPLGWVEPYDINSAGQFVGQARALSSSAPRYAFGNSNPSVPLVSGLDNGAIWAASAATSVNDSNTVVGWKQPKGGKEQAFYWTDTGGLKDIAVTGARNSRAESINNAGLVAGYYDTQGGGNEQRGFIYDIGSGNQSDFGPVVVESSGWFEQFPSVSINDAGTIAATHEVGSGNSKANQAFLLDGSGHLTPITPSSGFDDTFAAGISETGWVVGIMRATQGNVADSGFLWVAGQTIDLSELTQAAGWTIDAAYGVYSQLESEQPGWLTETGTILGIGTYNGLQRRAFAMQLRVQVPVPVPEPRTYLMVGFGLLALGAVLARRTGLH